MDLVFVFEYEHMYLCISFSQVLAAGLGVSQGKTQGVQRHSSEGGDVDDDMSKTQYILGSFCLYLLVVHISPQSERSV